MKVRNIFHSVDFPLLVPAALLTILGILTILPIGTVDPTLFYKQIVFLFLGIAICIIVSKADLSFLRDGKLVFAIYLVAVGVMLLLLLFAPEINSAKSWFVLGPAVIQPVEFAKIVIIIFLAKYFTYRHIAIGFLRHIVISLLYVGVIFFLTFLQPDLGSAVIIGLLWLAFVLMAGMSKKHFIAFLVLAVILALTSWNFLPSYQQDRVRSFITPTEDLSGSGYNAYQSKIALGSGQIFGKGIGQGTQSKLAFLPEYESDFIFSAYGEEGGFVGILIMFLLYGVIFTRILETARQGETNFEVFFVIASALYLFIQSSVHVAVNVGLFPVTGTVLPFVSYGGSHIIAEYILLGMIMSMRSRGGIAHKDIGKEFHGIGS